jgi:hypothetical protein
MMGEQLMPYLAGQGAVYVFKTNNFWTVLKSAGYAAVLKTHAPTRQYNILLSKTNQ